MKEEQEAGSVIHKGEPTPEMLWTKMLAVCPEEGRKFNLKIPIETVRKLFAGNNLQRSRVDNTEEMYTEKL